MSNPRTSRARRIAGNLLIFFGGIVLIASAGATFAQVPQVVTGLGKAGFAGPKLMLVAVLEVVSAVLFLVPRSRSAGLLLVSAYMGGAIATHVQHDQPLLQPAIFLSMLWLGAVLRHPEAFWSLRKAAPGRPAVEASTVHDVIGLSS